MEGVLLAGNAARLREPGLARGEDWRSAAACQDTDPDLFFPVSGSGPSLGQIEQAKSICAACPARRPCLAFAERTAEAHGIWGGRTEEERRKPAPGWAVKAAAHAVTFRGRRLLPSEPVDGAVSSQ